MKNQQTNYLNSPLGLGVFISQSSTITKYTILFPFRVLGISNFTPNDLNTLSQLMDSWGDIIQESYVEDSINPRAEGRGQEDSPEINEIDEDSERQEEQSNSERNQEGVTAKAESSTDLETLQNSNESKLSETNNTTADNQAVAENKNAESEQKNKLANLNAEFNSLSVEELVATKKQLYPNPDIESAMSAEGCIKFIHYETN